MSRLAQQFSEFSTGLSWSHPTWDLFIVVFLVVGTLLYGFSLGRSRIIMIMMALYMALVSIMYLPVIPKFTEGVQLGNGFVLKISSFLALFAILFFMLTRSALNNTIGDDDSSARWWHIMLLAFMQVGMLLSVVMSFLPESWLNHVSTLTRITFVSPWGKFVWVIMPIIGLTLVGISNRRTRDYL